MSNFGFGAAPATGFGFSRTQVQSEVAHDENFESTQATGVVLDNWRHAKDQLTKAQAEEKKAKAVVMNYIESSLKEGTNRFKTNKFTLKVAHAAKYSVAKDNLSGLNAAMQKIAESCGNEVASQLITWSPSLNKKAYESLPEYAKSLIDEFITLTYSDTLTIETTEE